MQKVYIITCEHIDNSKVIMAVKRTRNTAMRHLNWLLDWRYRMWGWHVLQDIRELPKKDRFHTVHGCHSVRKVLSGLPDNRTKHSEWLEIQEWMVTTDVPKM